MNRAAYQAQRQARPSREERGLPQHPASDGLVTCPCCDGRGEFTIGQSMDPQSWDTESCATCNGFGVVPDGRGPDPLLVMRQQRSVRNAIWKRSRYHEARAAAMRSIYRLPLADARAFSAIQERRMLAASQACLDTFNAIGVAA
jgi:hypothetical protein